jgi:hypothetical protein
MPTNFFSRHKNIILVIASLIISAVILLLLYLVLRPTKFQTQQKDLVKFLEQSNKEQIPQYKIVKVISDLKNKKSKPEEQYKDLTIFAFSVQDEYFRSNQPEIREFLKDLNDKVKMTYPKLHKDVDFLVTCADPICGGQPAPEESKLLSSVQSLKVDDLYKDTITINLKTAIYLPYDTTNNKLEKINTIRLVDQQLRSLNNVEASKSAEDYEDYIKKKYNFDANSPDSIPPNL